MIRTTLIVLFSLIVCSLCFTEIASADDNSTSPQISRDKGPIIVKSNGNMIGYFITGIINNGLDRGAEFMHVLSEEDYLFNILLPNGKLFQINELYYQSSFCKGQPYTTNGSKSIYRAMGVVYAIPEHFDLQGTYYIPRGTQKAGMIHIRSKLISKNECTDDIDPNADFQLSPVFPNDPKITGVPDQRSFPLPISLER